MNLVRSLNASQRSREALAGGPRITVIVPAYNARATLPACLDAINAMNRRPDEILVFSDGSTDDTDEIARKAGATVIRNADVPRGPAHGRNQAAQAATSDLLLFVDADVVISPDALDRMIADMQSNHAAAAFGSYDDSPRSQRLTSLYANLRHHYVHQHSARDATTFWSGLGLIDRETFLSAGGFDEKLFTHPSIEDIEIGARLVSAGHRIRLVPEALCKHWKDWSLWRVWHTDVVRRALPWSRLIADKKTVGVDLNVTSVERVKSLLALATLVALAGAVLLLPFQPPIQPAMLLVAAALCASLYIWLNRGFFGFLVRRLGLIRAMGAMAMHLAYHVYAPVTYVLVELKTKLGLRNRTMA